MIVPGGVFDEFVCFYEPVIVSVLEHDSEVCGALKIRVTIVLCIRQSARVVNCEASQP